MTEDNNVYIRPSEDEDAADVLRRIAFRSAMACVGYGAIVEGLGIALSMDDEEVMTVAQLAVSDVQTTQVNAPEGVFNLIAVLRWLQENAELGTLLAELADLE